MIMRASFVGRVENNHTAFIRIRTNKDDKQQMLIVPVEVEVTSGRCYFGVLLWLVDDNCYYFPFRELLRKKGYLLTITVVVLRL